MLTIENKVYIDNKDADTEIKKYIETVKSII